MFNTFFFMDSVQCSILLLSSDCSPHSSFLVTKFTRDQASFCWWFQLHCSDRFVKNKEWWTWLFLNFEQNFCKSIWSAQQVFPCVVGGDGKCEIYYFHHHHCLCHCQHYHHPVCHHQVKLSYASTSLLSASIIYYNWRIVIGILWNYVLG